MAAPSARGWSARGRARPRSATCRHRTQCPGTSARGLPCSFLELYTLLRLHPGREMMLHLAHLGDEIRCLDELLLGVATGDDHVQIAAARGKSRDDRVDVEIFVAQSDIELIQTHESHRGVGHQVERLFPGTLGGRDVARAVLRLPGEALAHRVPLDHVAEAGEGVLLAGVPGTL